MEKEPAGTFNKAQRLMNRANIDASEKNARGTTRRQVTSERAVVRAGQVAHGVSRCDDAGKCVRATENNARLMILVANEKGGSGKSTVACISPL